MRPGNNNNQGRRGQFPPQGRPQEPNYLIAHPFDQLWITQGANESMVAFAEEAGKQMAKKQLTNSKIRSIYGEIKRIQIGGFEPNKSAFYLLRPKVAYAYGREKENNGLKMFKEIFDEAVKYVNSEASYQNFCNLMEAILAYHRANGGK